MRIRAVGNEGTERSGAHKAHYVARHKMRQDHGRSVSGQRVLDHFPRMNAGAINGAAEHVRAMEQTVPAVEVQDGEILTLPRHQCIAGSRSDAATEPLGNGAVVG